MQIIKRLSIKIICLAVVLTSACTNKSPVKPAPQPKANTASITTAVITDDLAVSATGGGNITSDGGSTVTARGICWGTAATPTTSGNKTADSAGTGSYKSLMTGLTANTTYYIRAYATNAAGTAYGQTVTFTTGTIDLDGNLYHTVTIGTQIWMLENLNVTHYSNGDPVPYVTDQTQWENNRTSIGYCCDYNNDSSIGAIYGKLYNWGVVTDVRNICPAGWRLPTQTDWDTLENYLGGIDIAGGKMKEAGTVHWATPNTGGNNSSGFTALPAGGRELGPSTGLGTVAYFWMGGDLNGQGLSYDAVTVAGVGSNEFYAGFSIRCIRN